MWFARWKGANGSLRFAIQVLAVELLIAGSAHAQAPPGEGQVYTPQSSIEKPGDTGVRAHTNVQIFIPNRGADGAQAPPGSRAPGAAGPSSPQAPGTNRTISPAQSQ